MTPPPPNSATPDVAAPADAPVATPVAPDAQGQQDATTKKPRAPKKPRQPMLYGRKPTIEIAFLWYFVLAPFAALAGGIALAAYFGWFSWVDAGLFAFFFAFTGIGITVGYHRYFTHGAFKAKRWLRITLALAGSLAVEGAPIRWVADHRRHHQFAEEEEDPHSPWRFGHSTLGLAKGLAWAHTGWLFTRENSNSRRFAPDLVADPDIRWFQRNFVWIVVATLAVPTILGGLLTWSWHGALTAFLWAGLVRIGIVHHITWSVNSVCHVFGERPFKSNDKASNVWWLAILSFGESWHNLHHADPTCARHGVDKGQIDISARVIWAFEKLGWAWDVRWPNQERLNAKRVEVVAKENVAAA